MENKPSVTAEDRRLLASLDEEISRTWDNLLHAHDEHALGNLSARYNQLVEMRRDVFPNQS